jgi:hypothetical protein
MCGQDAGAKLSATPVVERLVAAATPAGWWLASCRLQTITKRADKLVAVYRIVLRDERPGDMRAHAVVAHLYGPGRGEQAHAALERLRAAGLDVPRPIGYDAGLGLLVHERVDGPTLVDHLVAGGERAARAAGEAGRWIARLQMLDLELPVTPPDGEETTPRDAVAQLATAYPEDARRLRTLGGRVDAALAGGEHRVVPSQGGLGPDEVVVDGRTVTVLDVDRVALREAAHDVGRTIAHLLITSGFRLADMRPGVRAAGALWRRYEASGSATWRQVRAHAAAGFVLSLHDQLCVARTERTELLVLWPRVADALLESEHASDLAGRLRRW